MFIEAYAILIGLAIVVLPVRYMLGFYPHHLDVYYTEKIRQQEFEAVHPELRERRRAEFRRYLAEREGRPTPPTAKGEVIALHPPASVA